MNYIKAILENVIFIIVGHNAESMSANLVEYKPIIVYPAMSSPADKAVLEGNHRLRRNYLACRKWASPNHAVITSYI